jgi:hypothetical protein
MYGKNWLEIKEAAEIFGVSESSLLINDGYREE